MVVKETINTSKEVEEETNIFNAIMTLQVVVVFVVNDAPKGIQNHNANYMDIQYTNATIVSTSCLLD